MRVRLSLSGDGESRALCGIVEPSSRTFDRSTVETRARRDCKQRKSSALLLHNPHVDVESECNGRARSECASASVSDEYTLCVQRPTIISREEMNNTH